jgi:hypothetical protein
VFSRWLWPLAFAGFFLLFGAWAAAVPPNGAFDEQPHVIRAAGASSGQFVPKLVGEKAVQNVPHGYETNLCWLGNQAKSAACLPPFAGAERRELETSAGRYFPAYYAVVGWPLNVWPGWTGLLLARLVSAALSAALVACAFVTLVRWSRHGLMLGGLLVGVTVTTASLAGAINPNGLEITAGIAFFAAGIPLLLRRDRPGPITPLVSLFAVSGCILATLKANGPMWVVVGLFALAVPLRGTNGRDLLRLRAVRVALAALAVAMAGSALWSVVMETDRIIPQPPGERLSLAQAAWYQVEMTHGHLIAIVGIMGWADARVPHIVYPVWWFVAACPIVLALALGGRLGRWRMWSLIGLTVGIPFLLQLSKVNTLGFIVQGRYMLPLLVGVALLACFLVEQRLLDAGQSRALTRLAIVALLPLHIGSLAFAMVRWQSGHQARYPGLRNLNPLTGDWHPQIGSIAPLVAVSLGVALIGGLAWLLSTGVTSPGGRRSSTQQARRPGEWRVGDPQVGAGEDPPAGHEEVAHRQRDGGHHLRDQVRRAEMG